MSKTTYGGHIFTQGIGAPLISCRGGYVSNVGLSLSSGILKIVQSDGSDFTSSAEGHVSMPNTTNGQGIRLKITDATNLFEDASGTSDIIGEEFGTTTSIAWSNSRPFYLYAVNSDDTDSGLKFAISPNPAIYTSPATANIAYHGNPASSPSDNNMFFLTSTDVTLTHNGKPAMLIGSLRMTKDASDDWTIQSLTYDQGIGLYQEHSQFTFPTGQMGASSGTFMSDFGTPGDVPAFSTQEYYYSLDLNGWCTLGIFLSGDGGNDGNGANLVRLRTPYAENHALSNNYYIPAGDVFWNDADGGALPFRALFQGSSYFNINTYYSNGTEVIAAKINLTLGDFVNGTRNILANFKYKAF